MPRTDMVTLLPEAIDSRRIELGISLLDFEKRARLSDVTLRTARAGKPVSLATALLICTALRCPLKKLLSSAKPKSNINSPVQPEVRAAI